MREEEKETDRQTDRFIDVFRSDIATHAQTDRRMTLVTYAQVHCGLDTVSTHWKVTGVQ